MTWNRRITRLLLIILAILPPAVFILGLSILYTWDWEIVLYVLFVWLLVLLLNWGLYLALHWLIAKFQEGYFF